jgi:hypothetical protein
MPAHSARLGNSRNGTGGAAPLHEEAHTGIAAGSRDFLSLVQLKLPVEVVLFS